MGVPPLEKGLATTLALPALLALALLGVDTYAPPAAAGRIGVIPVTCAMPLGKLLPGFCNPIGGLIAPKPRRSAM